MLARTSEDGFFEEFNEAFEVVGVEFVVELHAFFLFHFLYDFFEGVDFFFACGLEFQHDVAVHLHEAAVAVVGEAGVTRFACQAFYHFVVEAEVEDGVHHTGHRGAGTATHAHEQGIGGIAELLVGELFDVFDATFNIVF